MQLNDPTGHLARWALNLQSYDFEIKYRPGKNHGNADTLSRQVSVLLLMISSTYRQRIDLETLHDYAQTVPLGIYDYSTLRICSHDMFSSQAVVKSYKVQVYHYSPNITKFPIYSCPYTMMELMCDYENIFSRKRKSQRENPQCMIVQKCHPLIHNSTTISTDGTFVIRLCPIFRNFWRSYVNLSYSYTFGLAIKKTQHQVTIHKSMAQILWDTKIIEQHLTRT